MLLPGGEFEFIIQDHLAQDWRQKIQALPCQFKDPVKFERKIDPKKLQFGSKIDSSQPVREQFYSVKEVISPELVILSNGLKIKLIGVKSKKESFAAALNFLNSKLKSQRVFLRFDNMKYDGNGNLLCYLYLDNKTFINAHLIKNNLVGVDLDSDYSYKNKFTNLGQ
jgi:site-specific DNA-methyltransferase (adenine-specific)